MAQLNKNYSSDTNLDLLETLYYLYTKKVIILSVTLIALIIAFIISQSIPNKYSGSLSIKGLSSVQNPFNKTIDNAQLKDTFIHILSEKIDLTESEIENLHSISGSNLNKDSEEFLKIIHNSTEIADDRIIAKANNIEFIRQIILLKLNDANIKTKNIVVNNIALFSITDDKVDIKFSYQDQIIDMVLELEEKLKNENIFLEIANQGSKNSIISDIVSQILLEAYKNNYEGSIKLLEYGNAIEYFSKDETKVVNYSLSNLLIENLKYSNTFIFSIFLLIGIISSCTFILIQRELKNRNFS